MANVSKRNRRSMERIDNSFGKYSPEVVARPVDTYIHFQAPEDAGRNYRSLAASLAGLAPHVNQYLKEKHEAKIRKDEATGERLYYETGGQRLSWEDFREANDSRLKETGISTSIRNGYLKARMSNEANIYRESLNAAYNSGDATVTLDDGTVIPVSESDDPAIFNLWLNRFTKDYVHRNLGKNADPEYFAKVFVPQLERTGNELLSRHISERNSVLKAQQIDEHNKLISESVHRLRNTDGTITTDPERIQEVIKLVQESARDMIKVGVPHDEVMNALANSLIGLALDPTLAHGEDVLHLARNIIFKDGVSLWDTGSFAKTFYQQIEQIEKNRRYSLRDAKQEERERKQEEADAAAYMLFEYLKNDKPIPVELQQEMCKKFGVDAFNRMVSQLRNIFHGYRPNEDMLGRSTRDELDAFGRTSEQARIGNRYYIDLLNSKFRGETLSLKDMMNDPRWNLLPPSAMEHIVNLTQEVNKENKDTNAFTKQVHFALSNTASNYLTSMGIDKNHPDYELYMRGMMSIPLNVASQLFTNPEAMTNPDAVMDVVLGKMAEVGKYVSANPEILKEIADGNVLASDLPGAIERYRSKQVNEAVKREANAVKNSRDAEAQAWRIYREMMGPTPYNRTQQKEDPTEQEQKKQQQKENAQKQEVLNKQQNNESKPEGKDFYLQMVGGKGARVTSRYNDTRPVYGKKGQTRLHGGLDIAGVPEGTEIKCPKLLGCEQYTVRTSVKGSKTYGNYIIINGKGRNGEIIEVSIGHMKDEEALRWRANQTVSAGSILGLVGNTGISTNPHMDIKIKVNGKSVDPETYDFS